MRAEPGPVVGALAEAVADGEDVDWATAQKRLTGADGQLARNLRVVSELTTERLVTADQRARGGTGPLWFRALVAWSLLHVLGGLAALAFAPGDRGPIPSALLAANAVALAGVAVALLVSRGSDARARDLAGFLLGVASACSHRPLRWLMTGDLSSSSTLALFRGLLPEAFLPLFLWRFVQGFPRVVRLSRTDGWVRKAIRASAVVGVTLFTVNAVAYATHPQQPHGHPQLGWLARAHPSGTYWVALFALSLAALGLAVVRSREAPAPERRRFSLFAAGLALGLGPMLLTILAGFLLPGSRLFVGTGLLVTGLVIYVPLLTLPFTTAYAIAARRVFTVRLVLRRTAQRLLARSTLIGLPAAAMVCFAVYLYAHRDQSIASVLAGAGTVLALVVAGCGLLLVLRRSLLRGLDRVVFRTQSSPTTALAELGALARAGSSVGDVVSAVSVHVERGLQVEWAAVFAREDASGLLSAAGARRRPLPLDSALVRLLQEDEAPLVTDPADPRSVFRWLPGEDQEWLIDNPVGAVAALHGAHGRLIGVLAVGPKVDELPWSGEDRMFLATAASTAALALGGRELGQGAAAVVQPTEVAAGECTTCGAVRPQPAGRCLCGGSLVETPLPAVLNGKFRVEQVLGRGGMGVVYRALDLDLNRPVALKTLPRMSVDASVRLRNEARSMAAFIHPHLALIFGAESWRGSPVLIVEYLPGGTLARRLGAGMPWPQVLSLGLTLARALEVMHAKGFLHRDVKPSNIGFTADGVPKLLDFGLARLLGGSKAAPRREPPANGAPALDASLTLPGHVVGTPLYMPPEALAGAAEGPAQDVWGLSMVLYEAVTGTHPLRGRPLPPAPVIPDPRLFNPVLPSAISLFFQLAFHPRPEKRHGTASDLRQAVERLLAGLGVPVTTGRSE